MPTCESLSFDALLETLQTQTDERTHSKTARLVAALLVSVTGGAQPPMMISVARASGIAIGVSRSAMKNFNSFFDSVSGSTRT